MRAIDANVTRFRRDPFMATVYTFGALALLCGTMLGIAVTLLYVGPDGRAALTERCDHTGDPIACFIALEDASR